MMLLSILILMSSSLNVVAGEWPALAKPAPAVGGGEKDAAVIMAVENYAFVSNIPGAKDNANAWYDYLTKTRGIPFSKVFLSVDSDVTAEDMKKIADKAAGSVGDGGTLWYVFIGHGAPSADGKQGVLIGVDAQQKADSIYSRSLAQNDLLYSLRNSKAGNIFVFLDACFSGRNMEGEPLVPGLQPLVVAPTAVVSDPRLTVLTAAGSKEFAGQLPGEPRPAFSYIALGALRGWADENRDGVITAEEIKNYADSVFRTIVKDRTQTPQIAGEPTRAIGKSAREKGPDLSAFVRAEKYSKSRAMEFKISALPKVPVANLPSRGTTTVPSAKQPGELAKKSGISFGSVDVDGLEKYDAAVRFDAGNASPMEKRSNWLKLAQSVPEYAELANSRAAGWLKYAEDVDMRDALEFDQTNVTPEEKAKKWEHIAEKYPGRAKEAATRRSEWLRYAKELIEIERAKKNRLAQIEKDYSKLRRLLALSVVSESDKQGFVMTFADAYGSNFRNNPYIISLRKLLPPDYISQEDQKSFNMSLITEGDFKMGSDAADAADEKPGHKVYLSQFYIDRYETTRGEYMKYAKETNRSVRSQPDYCDDSCPIVNVAWEDADSYCAWMGKRLPTEAEWEYSARSNSSTKYFWGDSSKQVDQYAWYGGNSGGRLHPVGKKQPNTSGLYDISGNAWEWTADWYSTDYYARSLLRNPGGPTAGKYKVMRGGSWYSDSVESLKTTVRNVKLDESPWRDNIGFRCAYTPLPY